MKPRRIGLEQEIFVVEPDGSSSQRADDLLQRCHALAGEAGLKESNFATEWVKNVIELNTPPAETPEELDRKYLDVLRVALRAAHDIGVRLYPYSVYPIHFIPVIRNQMQYHTQLRTIGRDRFLNAGKCAGVHLHFELPEGTVDPRVGVSYDASPEARRELLNVYNLGAALDPVMIALSRACPFYEGQSSGLAHRTARYRGSIEYGWEGVYVAHPEVGSLRPYADSVEHLVQLQFDRHYAWMDALSGAEVDREKFFESGGDLLKSSWNPVRLNGHGTVEFRNLDSNMPEIILGVLMLVHKLHRRILEEDLVVTPRESLETIQLEGTQLLVPDFEYLEHRLLFSSVTEGIVSERVAAYVRSAIDAAGHRPGEGGLADLIPDLETFQTTEQKLLDRYYPESEILSREAGLQLVRDACDEFEAHIGQLD